MDFLYFPEDKTEYIPALIELAIFMILACVAMYLIYRHSKKESRKIDQQYNLHQTSSDEAQNDESENDETKNP